MTSESVRGYGNGLPERGENQSRSPPTGAFVPPSLAVIDTSSDHWLMPKGLTRTTSRSISLRHITDGHDRAFRAHTIGA